MIILGHSACVRYVGAGKMHNDVLRTYRSSLALYGSPPILSGGLESTGSLVYQYYFSDRKSIGAATRLCHVKRKIRCA